jgi:hypothetical protein
VMARLGSMTSRMYGRKPPMVVVATSLEARRV